MVFEPNDCSRLASRRIEKPFPASSDEAQERKELHFSLRVPLFLENSLIVIHVLLSTFATIPRVKLFRPLFATPSSMLLSKNYELC